MDQGDICGVVGFWIYFKGFLNRLDGWIRKGEDLGIVLSFFFFGLCSWKDGENRVRRIDLWDIVEIRSFVLYILNMKCLQWQWYSYMGVEFREDVGLEVKMWELLEYR